MGQEVCVEILSCLGHGDCFLEEELVQDYLFSDVTKADDYRRVWDFVKDYYCCAAVPLFH